MRFYTGKMFPEKYQGAIFVARHGPWNRTKKYAADVVAVFLNANGTVKSVEPFMTGLVENNSYLGRPVDVLVLKDGSLLVSAEYVSRLPPPAPPANPPDPARLVRGRALTRQHPCGVCHNPDFSGREQMPRLAHQREDYLLKAMREYKSGARIGYAGAMATELQGLSDDDLRELAYFFSHLPPAPK
jgi:Cytochrome c